MVLYKLLARISPGESDALLDFLASPFFNKNDRLRRLAELLLVHVPDFERVDRSRLFRQLFPGEALDRQRLNELYSQLAALVRTFLWQQQLRVHPDLGHAARFAAFQERGLLRDFQKLAKTEAATLQSKPMDKQAQLRYWQLHERLQHFPQANGPDLEQPDRALDFFYYCVKLQQEINALAKYGFYAGAEYPTSLKRVLQAAEAAFPTHPLIRLYLQLPRLLQDFEATRFQACQDDYYALQSGLDLQQRYFFFRSFLNIFNKDPHLQKTALQSVFKLYQHAMDQGLFRTEPMTETSFLNIVTIAAYLQEKTWALEFMQAHLFHITPDNRTTTLALGEAILLVHGGATAAAYQQLRAIPMKHFDTKLRARPLIVRCLLELHLQQEIPLRVLLHELENCNQFLYRSKKLQPTQRAAYLNMNKAVLRITQLLNPQAVGTREKQQLRNWLEALSPCVAKDWLLGKLQ